MDIFQTEAEFILLYDGHCPVCRRSVAFLRKQTGSQTLEFVPLQTEGILKELGISEESALREIQVIDRGRRVRAGADGLIWALSALPHWRWLKMARRLPGFVPASRLIYQAIASRRKRDICTDHTCR